MAKKVTVSWTTANLHGETSVETRHHSVASFSRCNGVIRALFSRSILVAFFAALIVPLNNRAGSLPGQATLGFGGSEQEITESLDTLIPLSAPNNGLLFFNPKITTSDTQDARVSLGLGYRQLFEQPEIILGANVFYDNYATDNNNRIEQFGVGGEMLTHWFDLRANFYLPDQKRYKVDQGQSASFSQTFSSSSRAVASEITSQTVGYQGHHIDQIINGVNLFSTTVTTEDIETTHFFDREQAGMLGGNVEAGVLLPWVDRYTDVRVFGGYYAFDNKFGKTVQGAESRLEIRAVPAVTFDAVYYANKEVIGGHWYAGIRFNMPFDLANMAEGKSPFAGFWDAFKPKSKQSNPPVFSSRLTENVIRNSRVTTSTSGIKQVASSSQVVATSTTTQVTEVPFSRKIVLTLNGLPITVTHVNSAASSPGNGTFARPYSSLTLASADPVKRDILLLYADSVFSGQSLNVRSGQELLGDASGLTHLINTDQLGVITLPHPSAGTALPIISNPGGTAVTVSSNEMISGLDIINSAHGIVGTQGASNVTISSSSFRNMTAAAIDISPATNISLNKLTFRNDFKDVILDAANTVITNITSTGATDGSLSLVGTEGITELTNVSISGAGGYGLSVTNPGGTHNITNLDITGGTGDGVDILGGSGVFGFDSISSITNTGGTAFNLNGGSSTVTFNGTIAGSATGHSVEVQNHTGGAITFFGKVTDIGLGINLANNTGGSITFSGPSQTLNTGPNTALTLNANNGASISFSKLAITTTTGTGIAATGANSSVTLIGTNKPGPAATAFTFTNTSGTYDYSSLTSSQSNVGLTFDNTQTGTYKLGSLTIASAPGAAAFSGNTSAANITLANLTVTNAAGIGLNLSGDTGSFAVTGATTINSAGSDAIHLNAITGPANLGNVNVTGAGTAGLVMVNSSAALTAGTITIDGAPIGLRFGANTGGSFTATGATNLTNITTTGINANGATGTYSLQDLSIGFTGTVANTRGIDFRSSDLQFQTGNLSITGNGTPTSIAIDLSASLYPSGQPVTPNAPNIMLATAPGEKAVISNVGTGVKLGDTTLGSAGAYLRYGNQTPIGSGGSGSSIAVLNGAGDFTIDASHLTSTNGFTQGRYEFTGVTFTGLATFERTGNPNFVFVGANSSGNDSGSNPSNTISVAQLLTLDGTPSNLNNKTVVFVNDGSINFGATTLTLGTGTIIDGFGNGNTVVVPNALQPANVIGDTFKGGGGPFTDPRGAATLTANASVNVLTLGNGDTVENINIQGGNNQIIGSGIAGFTLNGVVQTNAGASAINLTNTTGTIAMTGGSISGAAGNSFVITGGNSAVSYSGNITNTVGHSVVVQNRTGGSVTLSGTITDPGDGVLVQNNTGGTTTFSGKGDTFNTGANQAVTLTNNTGATTNFTGGNLAITTTSGTGFGASGGGTVNLTGTGNTITSSTGSALNLNGVTIGSNGFVLQSVSANGAVNGIVLNNLTGSGTVGVQVTGTGSTANSGGTIQNTTGAAVSLTNLGSLGGGVTLDNMNITGGGGISGTTFGTLTVANDSVAATGAAALSLTTGTIAGTFSTLSSNGSATNGISLDTITGGVNLGNVSVTNAATTGLVFVNSSAAVTAGTVTINGATTGLQFGTNTGGSFTVTGATNLTNITTTGINANGATGTYTFGGLSIGFAGAVANSRGIDFRSSDVQFQTGNLSITGNGTPTSVAIDLSGSLYPGGQPVTANAPNILLATAAGQTAVISSVNTGVLLGDTIVGSSHAYLRYGNQTPIGSGGSGSSIAVISGGVTIDTSNLTSTTGFMQGRYEFTGVTFTGLATFEHTGNPNFVFVGASSSGNDSGSNPSNTISVAQLLTLDGTPSNLNNKTVVFVNDASINFGATTLTLGTGTIIDGFGNGNTVVVPNTGTQPANVIGDTFVLGGGTFTDSRGAATLTANATVNVLTLGNGDLVQNINITGGNNQIIGSGIGGFTLNGVVQTDAGGSAVSLTNTTGTIAMTGGSISGAAGDSFVINGGNSVVSYSGSITNTASHSVVVQNRTGGSVTLSGTITDPGTGILVQNNTGGTTTFSGAGDTFNTGANQAVTLTNNTGSTVNFTGGGLTITTTSGTGFGASGGGTVSVTGTGNTITSGTGTALSLNGVTIGSSGFVLQSVSANGAANGIALNNLTGGGTVGVQVTGTGSAANSGGTIQNTTGAAVSLTNLGSLGGGVTLNNMSIAGGGGILGTTFGTLSVANDSVSATGAAALSLTTGTIATGSTFSTVSSTGSAINGISLDAIAGGVDLGNVSITNPLAIGLVFVNSSAAVTAGTVTINGAPTGLQFGANTGAFDVNGATNLTNITTTGIDANGATGTYTFGGLSIGFTGTVANSRGIDFRSSDVRFQTGNLSITGNGTPTSIGIDLSGSLYPGGQPVTPNAPNILLATVAGQTAVISNVDTGVKLGDTTVGSAGAYLRYGNQTPIGSGGSGSSIAVISGGVTIDTTNLTSTTGFMQGRYEFTGVTYTGMATFEQAANPNFLFVSETSTGNGTGSNPSNTLSVAQLLTLDGTPSNLNNKTVVFVNANGTINFVATTLTLGTGTTIDGFGNGATVVVPGGVQPANVIGDTFKLGGGSFTDPRGAATLTANASVNVLTLGNGDTVQNINIMGGNNQIIGSGIAGFTLNGVVQTNAGGSAISLTNSTGTIAMTGGRINFAGGDSFVINGGNSVVSYSGNITNTASHSVVVESRTGGSVTLSGVIHDSFTGILIQNNTGGTTTFSGAGDIFSTGPNQAVTLTNNTGATTDFTGGNLSITTASGIGFGASGGGTVSVSGTGNAITSGTGTALSLNGVTIGSTGFVLQSVSANGAANGIALNNLTGGGTVGVQVTGTGGTASTGGTIQNTTGAAASLTNLGSLGGGVTLNNMNITSGGILGTTFGTLSVANDSVSVTATSALSLTTGTIAAGSSFSTLSSSGSGSNGVLLSGVSGSFTANAGTITGAGGAAWSVVGGIVDATYSGNITQANNAALVSISGGHTGTLTFQTGTLSATNGTGLQFNNADGTYNFNGTTTLNGGNAAIDILAGSSGTFSFSNNTSITNPTGTAFVANGSSANVTYNGNITKSGTSAGLIVDVTSESGGTITFQTGTLSSSSSAGTGINLSSADGTVNFNGTTTLNGGNAHVDINTGSSGTITFGSGASIGATTSPTGTAFNENTSTANVTYNGTIRQTNAANAVSISAKTGGTTTFGGAITADTTTANGINLTGNTGGTINFTGGDLAISTTTGIGFNATGGGTINVTGSGNSISSVNATALNVANTTIGGSGLTFESISSGTSTTGATEPVSGIILNTTGSLGGLTVTGDGNTSVGGDSSGGTIQHTTGVGIALTNTADASFTNMNIQNTARSGIAGTGVTNFTFNNGTINSSGTAAVAGDADANIAFNSTSFTGAQTKIGNNISGTLTVTNSILSNGFSAGLDIQSDAGTVTNANVSNNTVSNPGSGGSGGTAGISFVGTGNTSTSFSLDNATINRNTVVNGAQGGIQVSIGNSSATGPGATAGIPNNSADVISITNNAVSLATTGTNSIIFATSGGNSGSRTQANFNISGNGRTAANGGTAPGALGSSSIGTVILIGNNGYSTMTGTLDHNIITASQTSGGGEGIGGGNGVAGAGHAWTPDLTLIVTNNTISGTNGSGIFLGGGGTSGTARLKVADNNVSAPNDVGSFATDGIQITAGNANSINDSVYLNIFGNTSAGQNGALGIALSKQGTNPAINVFGIFDNGTMPGSPLASPPTNTDVVNFVNANNPNGGGAEIILGTGFVKDTTQAPP